MPVTPAMLRNINGRIKIQADLGKKVRPYQEITREKRAGGVAQALECLPCTYKTLSSNTCTIKGQTESSFHLKK
jgi:hypothetical protein